MSLFGRSHLLALYCQAAFLASCGSAGPAPQPKVGEADAHGVANAAPPNSMPGVRESTNAPQARIYRFLSPCAESYKTRIHAEQAGQGKAAMAENGVRLKAPLEIDDRLNRAAHTISDMAEAGLLVTTPAIQETMWWHGIPEAAHGTALFQESDSEALRDRVDDWLKRQGEMGFNRYGAVTKIIPGGMEASVVAVKSHVDLLPVPRRVAVPRELRLEGNLEPVYSEASISVTTPGGDTFEPNVKNKSGRFASSIQLNTEGVWQVEILGNSGRGPTTLANFPVAVGVSVSEEVAIRTLTIESLDPAVLERMLFDMINREREKNGLERMNWSGDLARVARSYSKEMAKSGVVAHISPISGAVSDRVRLAGVQFAAVSENLAKAGTAEEAHQGLMRSPAHRANVLSRAFHDLGIGVELENEEGAATLFITEIFLAEREPIDPVSTADELVETINKRRAEAGRRPIDEHPWLVETARKASKGCFSEEKPRIEPFESLFKSVRAFYFKTNGPKINIEDLENLVNCKENAVGIAVNEGRDPLLGEEAICVTVLLGSR